MSCLKFSYFQDTGLKLSSLKKVVTSKKSVFNLRSNYLFGFNGMLKDNELKGIGNSLDYGARIYDSRIGRFSSLDPDRIKYPFQSPYVYANNTPIQAIDKEGKGIGYASLLFLAKQSNSTIAVGISASVSFGVGATTAAGMAVDPKGNFALFTSTSLGSISNTSFMLDKVGFGANINATVSILPFKDVTAIPGGGFSFGGSFYTPAGVGGGVSADFAASKKGDVSFQGFTASLGLGIPGGSGGTGGLQATTAVLLSGSDYKTIFDGKWEKQGVSKAQDMTSGSNGGNMGNPSGLWKLDDMKMTFSPVKGQKDVYSVNIELDYSYSTSGKGAAEGQQNRQISESINTGIVIEKSNETTYKSKNLK